MIIQRRRRTDILVVIRVIPLFLSPHHLILERNLTATFAVDKLAKGIARNIDAVGRTVLEFKCDATSDAVEKDRTANAVDVCERTIQSVEPCEISTHIRHDANSTEDTWNEYSNVREEHFASAIHRKSISPRRTILRKRTKRSAIIRCIDVPVFIAPW